MKHGLSRFFPLMIVLLLAALTFWLKAAVQTDTPPSGKLRHDPDYFVDNFTIYRFNTQGKLHSTLRAPRMLHFADDETSVSDYPDIRYYGERSTHITADSGWSDRDGKQIILRNNVVVTREGLHGNPPTVISSSEMYAYPDDGIARTDKPVVITQGKSVMHGIGLEANNKTQISVLGGRAQGTIYPKPH